MVKLITKEYKLKDLNPDIATRIAKDYNMKEEDITFIRKGYSLNSADLKFDEKERSSIDYITTKTVDRDGEIVDPDGIELKDYMKTPVVLYCHKYHDELPVGKCAWIKSDAKGLIAKTIYASHAKAEEIYQYRKEGFPMAKSIGFVPLEVENLDPKKSGGAHRRYPKSILLEYSDVPVPSNPDAVEIAINKGILMREDAIELGYLELEDDNSDTPKQKSKEEKTETKTMETESVKKTVDSAGNVSVFDILGAIQKAANQDNKMEMQGMMNQDNMNNDPNGYYYESCYVQDLFPYDYPNGTVVIQCNCKSCTELFQYDYSYDNDIATLINPKSVEMTYVADTDEMKSIKEELTKGWFLGSINKPETGPTAIHIPVESEIGKHTDCKIRTISISKAKGIQAHYCVDDKVITGYVFSKDKWTMATAKKWVKDHSKDIDFELIKTIIDLEDISAVIKGVIAYHDYGKADEGESWDAGAEVKAASVEDLMKMCAYVDSEAGKDKKTSYKFPHHKQSGFKCVFRAIANGMSRLTSSTISDADKKGVYNHLKKHYVEFGKDAPEYRNFTEAEIKELFPESFTEKELSITDELLKSLQEDIISIKEGKVISGKNKKLIQDCIDMMDNGKTMLGNLIEATDTTDTSKEVSPNVETNKNSETDKDSKIPETKTVATEDGLFELEDEPQEDNLFDFSEEDLKEIVTNAIKDVKEKQNQSLNEKADESVRKSLGKVY